jgi:hypothetical protein
MEKRKGISRRYMFVAVASVLVLIGAASPSTARAQGADFGGPARSRNYRHAMH